MTNTKPAGSGNESATSIFEKLGKVFNELESHNSASEDKLQWKEIKEYFHNLERSLNKGFADLEEKEKAFDVKQSEMRALLVGLEAEVATKEQALIDRVQVLKDTAVADIAEAREKFKPASPEPVEVAANAENKVSSSSIGDPNSPIPAEESFSYRSGEHTMAVDIQPRPELTQFCEQMDAKGLLNFITENWKTIAAIRDEIPVALKSATEPAQLVLRSLEGFYPSDENTYQDNKRDASLQGLRRSCIMLLESVAPLMIGSETGADHLLSPETKQQAKAIADEWKPRLAVADADAANGNSLESEAFLHLLATFNIASEFDEEELCKLVLAVARSWQAPELCRSLGLTLKMPGLIEVLISSGRQVDAVHFIHAFKLTETFAPVPLLKTYMKDLRRISQGKNIASGGDIGVQNDSNAQELAALKAVVRCVEEYKLEAGYPLGPLQKRMTQLEKSKADKKRTGEVKFQQPKRPRANGGRYGSRMPATAPAMQRPQMYGERDPYMAVAGRYTHPAAVSTYDYQMPSQSSSYNQQAITQRPHYYPQDDRATAAPASYSAAATYTAAPTTYGGPGYTGDGVQPSHQPYM